MTSLLRASRARAGALLATGAMALSVCGGCSVLGPHLTYAGGASGLGAVLATSDQLPREPFFGTTSVWRQKVGDAPVSPDSPAMVANLAKQVRDHYNGIAALNTDKYSVPFYSVSARTPRQDVVFDDCQGKGYVPGELTSKETNEPFVDVPIPAGATPSTGTDGEMTIWSPDTDQLWELWRAHREDGRWHACWGGRLDGVSTSDGRFPGYTGVSASGLALASGVVGLREVEAGRIDHAISLALIDVAHYDEVSYPASRSDGFLPPGTVGAIPEGTRLRLDPSLDLASIDLTPTARMIAQAAQTYGFIVTDKAGAVAVNAERGPLGRGPGTWDDVLDTPSYKALANFPWNRLQALPFDYGRPSGQ